MGPNATGGHQTDRGHVTQRLKNGREEKKYSRGLDNSGNIEGISPIRRLLSRGNNSPYTTFDNFFPWYHSCMGSS
jgi:hypothetical protein